MSYEMKTILANSNNYGETRLVATIKYIVIHMTANDGDKASSNGNYFKNNIVRASAHYFVDDTTVIQSVPDNRVAWSVGGNKYSDIAKTGGGKYYGLCTNSNSISVELCDTNKNGEVYPTNATIENALILVRSLMAKYNVPKVNVIRHFDVNGKYCPKYWMDDAKWKNEFWNKISATASAQNAPVTTVEPNIVYKTYTNGKWSAEAKNNAVCGTESASIKGFMVKVSDGSTIKYRVHNKGKKWLPWVTGYDVNDFNNGYAGDCSADIDAIEIKCDKYDVRYNVSTTTSTGYAGEVKDSTASGIESYAGILGKPIDKVKVRIV